MELEMILKGKQIVQEGNEENENQLVLENPDSSTYQNQELMPEENLHFPSEEVQSISDVENQPTFASSSIDEIQEILPIPSEVVQSISDVENQPTLLDLSTNEIQEILLEENLPTPSEVVQSISDVENQPTLADSSTDEIQEILLEKNLSIPSRVVQSISDVVNQPTLAGRAAHFPRRLGSLLSGRYLRYLMREGRSFNRFQPLNSDTDTDEGQDQNQEISHEENLPISSEIVQSISDVENQPTLAGGAAHFPRRLVSFLSGRYLRYLEGGSFKRFEPLDSDTDTDEGQEGVEFTPSPIEEVRLFVPTVDDPALPTQTFRTWFIAPILCVVFAIVTQVSSYWHTGIYSNATILHMVIFLTGRMMASIIPNRRVRVPIMNLEFSLNPGPFTVKEHVLIYMFASAGLDNPYGLSLVSIVKGFHQRSLKSFPAFSFVFTTQMLGYGFGGLFLHFLVNSPRMWWPTCITDVILYRTLYEGEEVLAGYRSRFQILFIISFLCFVYSVVTSQFFSIIGSLSIICWIWTKSVKAQQIGSGISGLGIGSFSFDLSVMTSYSPSPLSTPFFSIINQTVGFLILVFILCLITYLLNYNDAKKFPFLSPKLFDQTGNPYDLSRIIDENMELNRKEFDKYSKIFMSVGLLFTIGYDLASISASATHFILFNWREARRGLSGQRYTDVHNFLMRQYQPIPCWWFVTIIISIFALSIWTCVTFEEQLQLPLWGVPLAGLLVLGLLLPVTVLHATTGQNLYLLTVSQFIMGYLYPGKPIGNLTFKTYTFSTMFHAQQCMYNLKLGQYMKVPPILVFKFQILGIILSSCVNFSTAWVLLSKVPNICSDRNLPEDSPWTCPSDRQVYSYSIIWGAIGTREMFSPSGQYSFMYLFFFLGMFATCLAKLVVKKYPEKKWLKLINVPSIFSGPTNLPSAGPVHYLAWFVVGCLSNLVYVINEEWWKRYNYLLADGIEVGVGLAAFLISILQLIGVPRFEWWGTTLGDHCPLASCPTAPNISVSNCPVFY